MLKKKPKSSENRDEVVQKLISEFDESTVRGKISYIKFLLGHYVSSETFHHMSDFFNKDLIREMNGIIAGLHKVENVLKTKCKKLNINNNQNVQMGWVGILVQIDVIICCFMPNI